MTAVRAYWCALCGPGNFGDALTPALLAAVGIEATWAPMAGAELVMAGSVLSKVPPGWTGTVLGTGLIRAGMRPRLEVARVLALRGRLTRSASRLGRSTPLGDPGLLAPILLGPFGAVSDAGDVAIAPHYVDHDMVGRHPGARVIDVRRPPAEVVAAIAEARELTTSSLHALVVADALGVPHRWEPHPAVIGGAFKFDDYASGLATKIEPGVVRRSPAAAIAERQAELLELVRSLVPRPAPATPPRVLPRFAPS